jgi:hypothetical protein
MFPLLLVLALVLLSHLGLGLAHRRVKRALRALDRRKVQHLALAHRIVSRRELAKLLTK